MSRAARPYAEALFSLAESQGTGTAQAWDERLSRLVGALGWADPGKGPSRAAIPAARETLLNPVVPADVRRSLLLKGAGDDCPRLLKNFLNLLVDRRRVDELPAIAARFHEMTRERAGGVEAVAEVATPPDDALRQRLERSVGVLAGAGATGVKLEIRHVPSLLGGIRLRLGDRVYDASLAGKLARLKSAVSKG